MYEQQGRVANPVRDEMSREAEQVVDDEEGGDNSPLVIEGGRPCSIIWTPIHPITWYVAKD
jgi:hypothetical protein